MKSYKANRFLIDSIDQRLGSVDKEIKFDKIAICVGLVLTIIGILLCCVTTTERAGAFVLGIILLISGVTIMYVLSKELFSDIKKAKRQ